MQKRISFQDEAARNRLNSILLVSLISVILFILVFIFVYIFFPDYIFSAIPIFAVFMIIYAYSSYRFGDSVVLSSTNAKLAEGREYQYLRDSVEGLSISAGIPQPKIYVIDNTDMNAFATGRDPEHASITVTTALIKELNRQELEGVLAHEISHIKNRDILFMMMVAVFVGFAAILSQLIIRAFWFGGTPNSRRDRRGGGIWVLVLLVGFILAIFAPIAVRLVQFAVSRKREYLADASSVELTRYPEGLASALEKIMKKNKRNMNVSDAVSHLFFVDPRHSALDNLYDTHPRIEDRIRKLRAM